MLCFFNRWKHYFQFRYLLTHPYDITHEAQRIDERLRWLEKEILGKRFDGTEMMWFSEKESDRYYFRVEVIVVNCS